MTEQTPKPEVVRNDLEQRYEIWYGGELAGFTVYEELANRTTFIHTEIDPKFGGKGLGSTLARHALDDVIERGRIIVAQCPFIAAFVNKHPEYDPHVVGKGA